MDIFMPNMPQPINGMIKVYDNRERTFTRPYSAKNVFFYKEGDDYFQGVRIPVSKARYRNMDALMDDLNAKIPLDFGVRRVCTPIGKTPVESVNDLQHMGRYVCTSMNRATVKNWELDSVIKTHLREQKRAASETDLTTPSQAAIHQKDNWKRIIATSTPPLKSSYLPRQILFILHQDRERVYRTLLRPTRLPTMDSLLTEISQSFNIAIFKIFTFEGQKITTVDELLHGITKVLVSQRHENPFAEKTVNGSNSRFPPIPRGGHVAPTIFRRTNKPPVEKSKSSSRTSSGITTIPEKIPRAEKLPRLTNRETFAEKRRRIMAEPEEEVREPRDNSRRRNKRLSHMADLEDEAKDSRRKSKRRPSPNTKVDKRPPRKISRSKQRSQKSTPIEDSVVKIQAGIRGYLARKELKKQNEAAAKIQGHAKKYLHSKMKPKDESTPMQLTEDDKGNMHKSAVKIQAAFRGRKARKAKNKPQSDNPSASSNEHEEEPPNAEAVKAAAITIQAAFRGHTIRKKSRKSSKTSESMEKQEDGEEKTGIPATVKQVEHQHNVKQQKKLPKALTYSISVFTGNRWAAGTDVDVYIKLHGQRGISTQLWLRQSADDPKFQQGQLDTFDIETQYLGTINNLTVGHTNKGYGGGWFLDRIIVTDMVVDKRQYVFFCNKWIDGGQVDRKLERSLQCAGFYELDSMPDALADMNDTDSSQPISRGNWVVTIVTGDDQKAGTSSRVFLTAYGTINQSDKTPLVSEKFQFPGSIAEFEVKFLNQVSFGGIGDIYKLRLEIDGTGEFPHWFVESVSMKDRDSGEQLTLNCKRWFGGPPSASATTTRSSHYQFFYELPMIRIGVEPMPVLKYMLKTTPTSSTGAQLPGIVNVQLVGEYGESGIHSIRMPDVNGDKVQDMNVNIECVMLGRLLSVDFSVPANPQGTSIAEGFDTLQKLWEKQGVRMAVGEDWLVEKAVVRDSLHAPYQFILADSRIVHSGNDNRVRKQLMLSDIDGLSTRSKEDVVKSDGKWTVTFWTGLQSHAEATGSASIVLYGDKKKSKSIALKSEGKTNFDEGTMVLCQVNAGKSLGQLYKLRLNIEKNKNQTTSANWYIRKLKVKHDVTEQEFTCMVETWLEENVPIEIPVVWPDVPPTQIITYQCTVYTDVNSSNKTDFVPFVEIQGEQGDTGPRKLVIANSTQAGATFKPANVDSFEIEAVSVKQIVSLRVGIDQNIYPKSDWFINRIEITDPQDSSIYKFVCQQWLSKCSGSKKMETTLEVTSTSEENAISEE